MSATIASARAYGCPTEQPELKAANPQARPPCTGNGMCDREAIVFVHGVFGCETTWRAAESGLSWQDLIFQDDRYKNFDVYTFDYPTSLSFWSAGNRQGLTSIAKNLADTIYPSLTSRYVKLHLVGHSLGGNVILTSFLFLKFERPDAHTIMSHFANVILLGTPAEGASIANLGWLTTWDRKLVAIKPAVENELPVLIEFAIAAIDSKRILLNLPELPISAAYEQDRMYGLLQIVSKNSATAVALDQDVQGFDKTHETLAKPTDRNDPVYVWVTEHILK